MAQRCGNCHGDGILDGRRCHCQGPAKRYFPPKAAKKNKAGYAFEKAHKCGPNVQEHLYTKGSIAYYLCECGDMKKVTV